MKYAQIRKLNEHGHRSQLETDTLRYLQKNKNIVDVSYESTALPYIIQKIYVPDFVVLLKDGRYLYLETKGYFKSEDRTKMRAVKLANPSLDIRMVFPKDNKINKNSEMRYSDWCEKYGFVYCIGNPPKDWFK